MPITDRASPSSLADLPPLLTTKAACAIAQCCYRTLARWCEDGRFASIRPVAAGSGRRLIDRDSFLAFLGIAKVA